MKTTSWGDYNLWGVQYENEQDNPETDDYVLPIILAQVEFVIRNEECNGCNFNDCEYCGQDFSDDGTIYTVTSIEWPHNSDKRNIRFKKEYKNFDEAFEEFHKQVNLEKGELIKNGY